jgi:hypothetical protein
MDYDSVIIPTCLSHQRAGDARDFSAQRRCAVAEEKTYHSIAITNIVLQLPTNH